MSEIEISDKARDLCNVGCGCDDDATDGCPNWNGERCTYAALTIQRALEAARAAGMREAMEIVVGCPLATTDGVILNDIKGERDAEIIAAIDARLADLEGI